MDHSFNINVAKKLGIASAVILNNLYWWIDKNRANDKHFHDGYYWTYNSRKAFVEQFPYLTERQIEYKVYDEEDKKERTLEECVTPLEVGSVRRVQVKKGDTREVHHFRVLEELKA